MDMTAVEDMHHIRAQAGTHILAEAVGRNLVEVVLDRE